MALSPDGQILGTAIGVPRSIGGCPTGRLIGSLTNHRSAWSLVFSSDGRFLVREALSDR